MLNPKLAPNWITNVKVIETTPNPGVSGTGPFHTPKHFFGKMLVPQHIIDFLHSYITHWIAAPYIEYVCSECSICMI